MDVPAWFRSVVNEVDHLPAIDLKEAIRTEASFLPSLLSSGNGDEVRLRRRLVRVKFLIARQLELMGRLGRLPPLPPVAPAQLRPRLAIAAARLGDELDRQGEVGRAQKLYEIKVLSHRLLRVLLVVSSLAGCLCCPCGLPGHFEVFSDPGL
jgi:hypothetical protein